MQRAIAATQRDGESAPPPVIGSDRVLSYVVVDRSVKYTGKQRLFVGDKQLGRVPRVAIAKSLHGDLKDYLILFCDRSWQPLGVTGAKSIAAARREVERHYLGLSERWVTVKTPVRAARSWLAQRYPADVCGFCGKLSYEVQTMFRSRSAAICSSCVAAFDGEMNRNSSDTGASGPSL